MEKVCEVGSKSLQNNFRVEKIFLAQNISRYFPA